jgi:hypothetical protein
MKRVPPPQDGLLLVALFPFFISLAPGLVTFSALPVTVKIDLAYGQYRPPGGSHPAQP